MVGVEKDEREMRQWEDQQIASRVAALYAQEVAESQRLRAIWHDMADMVQEEHDGLQGRVRALFAESQKGGVQQERMDQGRPLLQPRLRQEAFLK